MNTAEKEKSLAELATKFKDAPSAFLISYQGCKCSELTDLRRKLRPAKASFAVVKNTLAVRAVKGTHAAKLEDFFTGPTGVIWTEEDPVTPAKIIAEFGKSIESFKVKGGVVDGAIVNPAQIEALSKLPSKEELISKLLGLLNAPATKLLQTLNAPSASLVRTLEAWRKKQAGE